jgi:glycosyltransferase involved in cell wall biosynthesis
MKITHLTSAHPRYSTRIIKMCKSLAENKNNVTLIVADGYGDEYKNGFLIKDVGKSRGGRISRMTITVSRVYKIAKNLKSDIYHLHDPELINIGLRLKQLGKKVIFDIHENIPLQILDKNYIPKFLRGYVSKFFKYYQNKVLKKFDALILAENSYLNDYANLNKKIEIILNMPDLKILKKFQNTQNHNNEIFHIGNISNERGFDVTIEALRIIKHKIPDVFMHYIGPYNEILLNIDKMNEIKKNIKLYGRMPLEECLKFSKNSALGISILKPLKNYTLSYSTKVFEYMALGLPVVTSNFKLYRDIVEKYNCGLCVDPSNPQEIAKKIEFIFKNPIESKKMGLNGIKLTKEKFNWEIEKKKLIQLYTTL